MISSKIQNIENQLLNQKYWIDILFEKLEKCIPGNKLDTTMPLEIAVLSLLISLNILFLSILISYYFGVLSSFTSPHSLYVVTIAHFEFFWVLTCLRWGSLKYKRIWIDILQCCTMSSRELENITRYFRKLYNSKQEILIAIIFSVLLSMYIYKLERKYPFGIYIISVVYLFLASTLIITAIYGFIYHAHISYTLLGKNKIKIKLNEILNLSRSMNALVNFSLICAVTWFVGLSVLIGCFLIVIKYQIVSVSTTIILSVTLIFTVIGVIVFIIPLYSARKYVRETKRELVKLVNKKLGTRLAKINKYIGNKTYCKSELYYEFLMLKETIDILNSMDISIFAFMKIIISSILPAIMYIAIHSTLNKII